MADRLAGMIGPRASDYYYEFGLDQNAAHHSFSTIVRFAPSLKIVRAGHGGLTGHVSRFEKLRLAPALSENLRILAKRLCLQSRYEPARF